MTQYLRGTTAPVARLIIFVTIMYIYRNDLNTLTGVRAVFTNRTKISYIFTSGRGKIVDAIIIVMRARGRSDKVRWVEMNQTCGRFAALNITDFFLFFFSLSSKFSRGLQMALRSCYSLRRYTRNRREQIFCIYTRRII